MRRVNELFYKHRLFKNLDYSAQGTTYENGGVIIIDIDFYTQEALALEHEIQNLHIEYGQGNRNISIEFARIVAEESHQVHITNKAKVIDLLHKLDNIEWLHIDDVDQLDTYAIRRKTDPIYITDKPATKPRQLNITLSPNQEFVRNNPSLMPLFNISAHIFGLALTDRYNRVYGTYDDTIRGTRKPLLVNHRLFIARQLAQDITIDQLAALSREVSKYVFTSTSIKRLANSLQRVDYSNNILLSPGIATRIDETGVLIGSAGWRKIAKPENIEQILKHTTLVLKFGRQKATLKLRE